MKRLFRHRPSPGLVVAIFAVVLALGGTALAARGHKAKKVTTKQLHSYVRHYVAKHPGPRGPKGAKGATGAQGLQGLTGQRGPQGTAGRNGTGVVVQATSDPAGIGATDTRSAQASCPAGQVATGGGALTGDLGPGGILAADPAISVLASFSAGTGWVVIAFNAGDGSDSNADATVIATATCSPGVDVTPPSNVARVRAYARGLRR